MINKNKKIQAFSTTALRTLLGALLVVTNISTSSATSGDTDVFDATAEVTAVCTIAASAMALGTYSGSLTTATTDVTQNCTYGTTGVISLTTETNAASPNNLTHYKLLRANGSLAEPADVIEVSFTKTSGAVAMNNSSGSIALTGTGAAVTSSALITGTIAGSQSNKTAGIFSKSLTLTVTY
jgi:hypothetical protein